MRTYILYIDQEKSIEYAKDCRDSAVSFGLNVVMHEGLFGKQNRELTRRTGLNILTTEYSSEYCGTIGHIEIWKDIAESGQIGVVLEHDSVVMGDYSNLTVGDGEILFLGPRMFHRSHYKFPVDAEVDYYDVSHYNGAHAYMITPATAAMLLAELDRTKTILMPIDGLLGLKNKFNMKLKAVDPAFVISEIGSHRKSFNFDTPDTTNRKYFPKFLSGVEDRVSLPPIAEYKFTTDWFTQHIPHWLETFELAGKDITKPLRILEVGAYEGRSTCWISDNMLTHIDSRLDVIDTFEDWVEHPGEPEDRLYRLFLRNISISKNSEKMKVYPGDSRVFLPVFLKEDLKYDFIYIDGNHNTENVIIDGLCAFHLLKSDGVIIFDDYEFTSNDVRTVKLALDKLEQMLPIQDILTGWQRSYVKK
jgi:hypothetical protein